MQWLAIGRDLLLQPLKTISGLSSILVSHPLATPLKPFHVRLLLPVLLYTTTGVPALLWAHLEENY